VSGGGGQEPPPERFSSLLGNPEYSHPVNDAQKARILLTMQRQYGNRYAQRALRASVSAPQSSVQLQRKEAQAEVTGGDNLLSRIQRATSGGDRLESGTQARLEDGLGADLSNVRVHTNTEADHLARSVNARAFTTGQDIFFQAGEYTPASADGMHLLAHEAAHTVQQTAGPVSGTPVPGGVSISSPSDSFELEAERVADGMMAGSPERADTSGPTALQRQERSTKNEAASHVSIQRDDAQTGDAKPAYAQPGQVAEVGVALLEMNRPGVETARANALVRIGKITLLQQEGSSAIGSMKMRLMQLSERYNQAYKQYAAVIAAAKQEARDQQETLDLVVGIAIGVLVGLAFEVAAVYLTAEAAGQVVVSGLKKWGKKAATEAVGEGVEAGGAAAGEKTGLTEIAGKDLQPEGLKPEVLQMEIWRALSRLYAATLNLRKGILDQALLMGSAEYAIGEIKAQPDGNPDMSVDEDVELVLAVIRADQGLKTLDAALDTASEKIAALKSGIAGMPDYSVEQMEKDIWILWMSTLKKDSNILDIDAIEDHLTALGLVDFGRYTSDEDENEAIEMAKRKAEEVRESRSRAFGGGIGGAKVGPK
jgi:hypothetical protein